MQGPDCAQCSRVQQAFLSAEALNTQLEQELASLNDRMAQQSEEQLVNLRNLQDMVDSYARKYNDLKKTSAEELELVNVELKNKSAMFTSVNNKNEELVAELRQRLQDQQAKIDLLQQNAANGSGKGKTKRAAVTVQGPSPHDQFKTVKAERKLELMKDIFNNFSVVSGGREKMVFVLFCFVYFCCFVCV